MSLSGPYYGPLQSHGLLHLLCLRLRPFRATVFFNFSAYISDPSSDLTSALFVGPSSADISAALAAVPAVAPAVPPSTSSTSRLLATEGGEKRDQVRSRSKKSLTTDGDEKRDQVVGRLKKSLAIEGG